MIYYGYTIKWKTNDRHHEESIQCWSDISMEDAISRTVERAEACGWTPKKWWQWWRWGDTAVDVMDGGSE